MQTDFTPEQLANPHLATSEKILRKCVHCGFCTATCPTFVLLGDELDSPRGRIYMIKDMLENDKPASAKVVKHIDRCLSCLSCMTTCPSGVHYMHLVDEARVHIEKTYDRPLGDKLLRAWLALIVPRPNLFRAAMMGAGLGRMFRALLPGKLKAMVDAAPGHIDSPSDVDQPRTFKPEGRRTKRVALMNGCVQQALRTSINEATVRLLTRHGCEVVIAEGSGCCGAAVHHLGKEEPALQYAKNNIEAWMHEKETGGLDAVVINASGCGTTVKDYGHMLRTDPDWASRAKTVSEMTKDLTELVRDVTLDRQKVAAKNIGKKPVVAYHSACSMQHGQGIKTLAQDLLRSAGFEVRDIRDSHLCCGSAGTYNVMQPELAGQLKQRKLDTLEEVEPDVIATGNIGCLTHLQSGTRVPIVHTVELLDWATGGPVPRGLENWVAANARG